MELSEVLKKRRSIRHYISKEVSTKDIEKIIEAGILAPSAHHREPWEVIVLKKRKQEISHLMRKYPKKEDISIIKTADTIDRADTLLLIYCNNFEQFEYNLLSIGAMIENMLLQATSLGIGSLWIGNVCA
ncbi:MAG: nitroreductase family protein, partial [Bacilli bacterium]|nr:nitroreductase family protein [Bacilli bacterium]